MLGTTVGVTRGDSFAAAHGRAVVDLAMACARLVSAGSMQCVLCSLRLSAVPLPSLAWPRSSTVAWFGWFC